MTLAQFKIWLEGYLKGCDVESEDDLTEEQMHLILEQVRNIEEERHILPQFDFPHIDDYIPSWMRNRYYNWDPLGRASGHYMEKISYQDADGNYVEVENKDGKVKTRSNLKSVDKLSAKATKLIGEILGTHEEKSA